MQMPQNESTTGKQPDGGRRSPYVAPTVRRLGTIRELTQSRLPVGEKDGGANNTRSG